jgi:hypothetical protein
LKGIDPAWAVFSSFEQAPAALFGQFVDPGQDLS